MNKKKITGITKALDGVRLAMDELNHELSGGPASYYYERLVDYYNGCMAAAKFKVGQRVELVEAYAGDASGWAHCKHFMLKGAKATVVGVDYYKGEYSYDIEFDIETWIDRHGAKRVVEKKHLFRFGQNDLKKAAR